MIVSKDWWKTSVVYQVYPQSFYDSNGDGIGDLKGVIAKLDYLKNLGVNVIWLSPIYDSPQEDNGYDIRDYRAIHQDYGTMEDFDQLLAEIHARDMKLVMDLVVNHTSDEHAWFLESKQSKENPYRDYYIWRDGKPNGEPPTNWSSFFSGSAWQYDEQTQQYYLHLFAAKQPDLNWENPAVRQEIYDMMTFWLDKGIDGFRMDVINLISKETSFPDGMVGHNQLYGDGSPYYMNGPRIHEYLKEMHDQVLSKYDMMTVGEMPGVSPTEGVLYTNPVNKELNMVFTFEHMGLDSVGEKWDLKPLNLIDLKENFEKWQTALHGIGWNSLYWNNHDQPRIVSRFGNDQAYREKSAKMLATCLHFMQGTPYIYQGEELGMTNVQFERLEDYRDVETRNMYQEKIALGWSHERIMESIYTKGRDNARTPMQWTNEQQAGFTTGTPWIAVNPRYTEINADAAIKDSQSIYYYYQKLIQLRKAETVITEGNFELILRHHANVFAYTRQGQEETLYVLCNFSSQTIQLEDLQLIQVISEAEIMISNKEKQSSRQQLTPYEAIVYKIQN